MRCILNFIYGQSRKVLATLVVLALFNVSPLFAEDSPVTNEADITANFTSDIDTDSFITTWKTDNPGTSNDTSIMVPMIGGPYDVDWDNDGVFDELGLTGTVTHDFGIANNYTIRIRGAYTSIKFVNSGDKDKILSVDQWGTGSWLTMESAFWGASNLQFPALDTPDFSAVVSMVYMFAKAPSADPDTSGWVTSRVTNMQGMFLDATSANPDTTNWDTSAVKNMATVFYGATSADPDVSGWDTSQVTNMSGMFFNATSAKPDVSLWNTAKVTNMSAIFRGAMLADPDVSNWDTSAVTDMSYMFFGASVAKPVTSGANWSTAKVTTMLYMFYNATSADPDTSAWDTAAVTNMQQMFFGATSANPDVSNWDTGAVTTMAGMFQGASSFDRDIGSWNVSALTNASNMFQGVGLSVANYDSLLIGWDARALQSDVSFSGGNSVYCAEAAINARAHMIAADNWVITDGGQCPPDTIFADGFEALPEP
jgi:surface protein